MTTKEILRRAKRKIEAGWCKGYYERQGSCCADGALILAARHFDERHKARSALRAVVGRQWSRIEHWNDAKERTKRQVLEAFDKAIASCG